MKCCICNGEIEVHALSGWDQGHNAEPVMSGRCCDGCNDFSVLPRRIINAFAGKDPYERIRNEALGERERRELPMRGIINTTTPFASIPDNRKEV